MKYLKLLSICLLASFTMSVSAEMTSQATIKVKGDVGGVYEEVFLTEDNAAPADFSSNDNAPFTKGTSNLAVELYAANGADKYSTVVIKSLDNLKLKFVANAYEEDYTMSFSGVTGSIILANADTSFIIDATKDYKFTCAKSATVEFTISMPYTRNVTAGDWGTICLPKASSALEGATFYKSTGEADPTKGVALEEVSALEPGKPYVFKATAAQIKVTLTGAAAADTLQSGGMVGSFYGCPVPKDMYIIVDNKLYKAADGSNTIAANRAYFDVESMDPYTPAPGRKVIFFGGKGAATGLEAAEAPAMNEGKMIINGKLVIIRDGKMFNAQGAAL